MGKATSITKDLLSVALTKEVRVLGVPFSLTLQNASLFLGIGLLVSLVLLSAFPLIICMLAGVAVHFLLMIVTRNDEKALSFLLTKAPNTRGLNFKRYTSANESEIRVKKEFYEDYANQKIPYHLLIDANTLQTFDGQFIQIIELEGLNYQTASNTELDQQKKLKNRILKQVASPNLLIQTYLINELDKSYPKGRFSNWYANSFNKRYQNHIKSTNLYKTRFFIALTHKNDLETLKKTGEKLLNLYKGQGARLLAEVQHPEFIESEPLSFVSRLINLDKRVIKRKFSPLTNTLQHNHLNIAERKGLIKVERTSGETIDAAILFLKEYPEESYAGMLDSLLSVKSEFILTQSFEFFSGTKLRKHLKRQRNIIEKNDGACRQVVDVEDSLEAVQGNELAFGDHHLSICVIASQEKALNATLHTFESTLNERAGLLVAREHEGLHKAFFAQLPGNLKHQIRKGFINTINYSALTSFHNSAKGKLEGNRWGSAITMAESRDGSPYAFNIHLGQVANTFAIGPMGKGKTLVLAMILAMSTKYGGWRFIFDKDRGMEIVVRMLGGSYTVLTPGEPTGMAPLQLEDTSENRAFNILLLKRLLARSAELTSREEKMIEDVIESAYQLPRKQRTFANIAPFFGPALENSLRERFDRWHSNGANAWVFDNDEDNFVISNQIYGLDVGGILEEAFEEVSTPIFMYLFNQIGKRLDSSPSAVFLPEGWKFLQDERFKQQIEDWSRTPRKNNLAFVLDTQSPNELAKSEAGASIARESVSKIFFANETAEWEHYEKFNLTEKEFNIIKHELPLIEDQHFFLFKQGKDSTIIRFNLFGLESDISVLSSNLMSVQLLDKIRERAGEKPEELFPLLSKALTIIAKEYGNDIKQWEPAFDAIWETIQCD
jgi:type IV secretion system protein VirB4